MPNRILKESICISDDIDKLSWLEEVFFYRLIVNCDDYGRFDARPAILKSRLFPLKDITVKQIDVLLNKLVTVGMVRVYEYDRQPYLQLLAWEKHQQVRARKSKYPAFDNGNNDLISSDINCNQANANVPVIQSESESISESNIPPTPKGETDDFATMIDETDFSDKLKSKIKDWSVYKLERKEPYKPMGFKSLLTEIKNNVNVYGETALIELIGQCMSSGYKGIIYNILKENQSYQPKGKDIANKEYKDFDEVFGNGN